MDKLTFKGVLFGLIAACGLATSASAWAKAGGGTPGEHEIQMMDTDHDGKISAAEHAAGAQKMFQMMDTDKDGKVTVTEMQAHHDQMMGGKKGAKTETT